MTLPFKRPKKTKMPQKTYNIHEILDFANRAEFTLQEFEMNYDEEVEDLAKRGIQIQFEDDYFCIPPDARRDQIGSGIFTIGEYPEIPPPLENPQANGGISTTLSAVYTDEGVILRVKMYHVFAG